MKKLSLILLGLAFTIFGITFAADNELNQTYNFAYQNGITTMDSIDKANMDGSLNRIAMAKMLSNYAMNILGKKPANTVAPKFSDVPEQLNKDYDGAVELAYQLDI